jgi:hypothetical protein
MVEPLQPTQEDIKNFLIGGTVVGAAFAAYKQVTEFQTLALFILFGLVTLAFRELGQRIVAQWMDSEVHTELSRGGAATTLVVGIFSYISTFNLAFMVPVFSSFSAPSYEHWGKSIDAIWAKRQYWLASSGITSLLIGWSLAYTLGVPSLAELISLFTFFQLFPLDEEKGITGDLDGAYIMLWTGFMWLVFVGLTIIAMVLSVL